MGSGGDNLKNPFIAIWAGWRSYSRYIKTSTFTFMLQGDMQISRFDMLCAQAHWVGSKRRVMQLELQWSLATHCACAHDMSIRPILVEVTMYLGQNRYRKPRCRIVLFLTYKYVNYFIKLSTGRMWCNLMQQNTYIGRLFRACQRHRVWFAGGVGRVRPTLLYCLTLC